MGHSSNNTRTSGDGGDKRASKKKRSSDPDSKGYQEEPPSVPPVHAQVTMSSSSSRIKVKPKARSKVKPLGAPSVSGMGRGSYVCSRCGEPKKGHVCIYEIRALQGAPAKPNGDAASPIKQASVQVEMDKEMTVRAITIDEEKAATTT